MTSEVSLVIPTCNRLSLLGATLESAVRQTRPFREIIVVDNGSQDAAAVTRGFGPQVRLINLPPGSGVQRARNAGIEAARTPWVATLDDDDHYRPDFLETVWPALEDGRADIVFADHIKNLSGVPFRKSNFESAPRGYWTGLSPHGAPRDWAYVGSFPLSRLMYFVAFYPSTMIISKELFHRIGGYDPRVKGIPTEDIEFLVRALHRGKLAVVWRRLVDYHIHPNNTSGDHDRQRIGRWRVFEFIRSHPRDLPIDFINDLDAHLRHRRRDIFDFTFHKSRFDDFDAVAVTLGSRDWTLSRRLYRAVRRTPPLLRRPLAPLVGLPARLHRFLRRHRRKSVPILSSAQAPSPGGG